MGEPTKPGTTGASRPAGMPKDTPPPEEEARLRVALATSMREETIAPDRTPLYYYELSERFIRGLRLHAQGEDTIFPPENRRLLQAHCLRMVHTQKASENSSADYGWIARAALLETPPPRRFTTKDLDRAIETCLKMAKSLVKDSDPSEKELGGARPWFEAGARTALASERLYPRHVTPFPSKERKQFSRFYYKLAGSRFDAMRFDEAHTLYNLAIELDPTLTSARFNHALTLAILKQNMEAKVEVFDLVGIEGWTPDAAYLMGFIAENEGRTPEAVRLYAKAIADGDYANAWTRLSSLLERHRQGKDGREPPPSEREPEPAPFEIPGQPGTAGTMVRCIHCARDIMREVHACPFCGSPTRSGGSSTAREGGTKAPPEPTLPTVDEVSRRYGGGLGMNSGDSHRPADLQIAWLEEAVRVLVPPGPDPKKRAELAVAFMELDRTEEARALLEALQRENPNVSTFRAALLRTLYRLKDWDGVLRLAPTLPDNHESLRYRIAALLGKGRGEEVKPLISKLPLGTAPECEEAARYLAAVKDREGAMSLLDRAISIDAAQSSAHLLKELLSGHSVAESPRSTLSRFEGIEPVINLLVQRVVAPLLVPENYYAYDISDFQVLLAGPPGCGKTSVARALAKEASATFEYLRFDRVGDLYYGETEKAVHQLFLRARRNAAQGRVILFIDEVDSFASARRTREERNERRLFTQIMTELSELSEHLRNETLNMRVIGATNRPFDLDPAMLRTGRLGMPVYLGPPNLEARRKLIEQHLKGLPRAGSFDMDLAARGTEWYSMSDVQGLLSDLLFEERSSDLMSKDWKLTNERLLMEIEKRPPSVLGWFRQVDRLIKGGEIEATDLGRGFEDDYRRYLQWVVRVPTAQATAPPGRRDRMYA